MDHKFKCSKCVKRLEENSGENLQDIRLAKEFSDKTPQPQIIKGEIDKLDFLKNKTFTLQKPC